MTLTRPGSVDIAAVPVVGNSAWERTPRELPRAAAVPAQGSIRRPSARTSNALRVLLVVLSVLNLGRLNGLTPALATFPIGKVFLPLCWLVLVVGAGPPHRFRALRGTQVRMFALLICAMAISVVFSLYPGGSFEALKTFLQGSVPYVLLLAVACSDEGVLYSVGRAMVITGALLGTALFVGFAKSVEGRMYLGDTYDPNDIALVGVVILPMAVWLVQEKGFKARAVGLMGAAGSLALILASASRGGMLGLATVLALVAARHRRRMPLHWKAIATAILCVGLWLAPSTFWDRLQTLEDPNADYNTSSLTGREAIWTRGMKYFESRPFTGVGLGEFGFAEGTLGTRYIPAGAHIRWSQAHSVWVEVTAETGLLGIISFLGLYLPTLRDIRRVRSRSRGRSPPQDRLAAFGDALGIAIIGFFVSGTFLTMAYSPPAILLAGLGMAYAHLAKEHRTAISRRIEVAAVLRSFRGPAVLRGAPPGRARAR